MVLVPSFIEVNKMMLSKIFLFQQKKKSKYCVLKVNIFNKSLKSANYFNAEFTKESFVKDIYF